MKIVRFKKRLCMTIGGVTLAGIGVAGLHVADFGIDPFQTFAQGLGCVIPINYGTLYAIINIVLLTADFFLDKHYIGIATFFNLFLVGYIVDFFSNLFDGFWPDPSLPFRIFMLIISLVVICLATSLYFTSDLGISTYDALIKILADRHIMSFKVSFIVLDCICVAIGWACGCIPGIGTILTAFFMGPLVDWFNFHFSIPFLWGKDAAIPQRNPKSNKENTKVRES